MGIAIFKVSAARSKVQKERRTMIQELIRKTLKPIIDESLTEAYKQGSEDTIRRFAFVYDVVAQTARADEEARRGEISIEDIEDAVYEEIDRELHPEVFGEVEA